MAVDQTGGCKLFIPRKNWQQQAGVDAPLDRMLMGEGVDPTLAAQIGRAFIQLAKRYNQDELANYIAIEQWANACAQTGAGSARSATVTIAASNAKAPTEWDLQATGSGDEATLATAIASLTVGGRIVLSEGTFDITGVTTASVTGVTIEGQGYNTIIRPNSSIAASTRILDLSANSVTIKNLRMDMTAGGGASSAIPINIRANQDVVDDVTFDSSGLTCVDIGNTAAAHDCIVRDSHFGDASKGVRVFTANHCKIIDNWFTSTGDGVELTGGTLKRLCLIANNHFVSMDNTAVLMAGTSGSTVLIEGNTVYLGARGFHCSTGAPNAIRFSIQDNFIDDCIADGILIEEATCSSIEDNYIRECGGDGILLGASAGNLVDDIFVSNNDCVANTGFGISVTGGANANRNIVVGNRIPGTASASGCDNAGGASGLNDAGTGTITAYGANSNFV